MNASVRAAGLAHRTLRILFAWGNAGNQPLRRKISQNPTTIESITCKTHPYIQTRWRKVLRNKRSPSLRSASLMVSWIEGTELTSSLRPKPTGPQTGNRVIKPKKAAMLKQEKLKKVRHRLRIPSILLLTCVVETLRWPHCSDRKNACREGWSSGNAQGRKEGEGRQGESKGNDPKALNSWDICDDLLGIAWRLGIGKGVRKSGIGAVSLRYQENPRDAALRWCKVQDFVSKLEWQWYPDLFNWIYSRPWNVTYAYHRENQGRRRRRVLLSDKSGNPGSHDQRCCLITARAYFEVLMPVPDFRYEHTSMKAIGRGKVSVLHGMGKGIFERYDELYSYHWDFPLQR